MTPKVKIDYSITEYLLIKLLPIIDLLNWVIDNKRKLFCKLIS